MNTEQILALVNAGFTKQEILTMAAAAAPDPEPAPEPVPAPPAEAVPEPEPVPEPVPAAEPKPEPEPEKGPTLADVLAGITKLTGAIQANAIASSVVPQQPRETAEDMIAQIIRPTFKERSI